MSAESKQEFLCFMLGAGRYGVRASDVNEVLPALAMAAVPTAPPIVEGVIAVRGAVVPLVDLRARFRLAAKPVELSDHIVLARAGGRRIAFRVDRALDLLQVESRDIEDAGRLVPGTPYVAGVATLPDGVMLIHDLGTFLSQAEAEALATLEQEAVGLTAARPA